MDRFEKKHGTFICRKLLKGCELTTEEGQKHFKENKLVEYHLQAMRPERGGNPGQHYGA